MSAPRPPNGAGAGGGGAAGQRNHKPHTATTLRIPQAADVRLHIHDDRFLVCCACPPVEASPGAILSVRPSVNALVTLPAGWTWPDPAGEALADAVMQKGGGFMFECERLADALACATRLKASRQ